MSGVLVVTWDGGGNVPPALGISAELIRRGRDVHVLGHAQQASDAASVGASFVPYRTLPAWDPEARGSEMEFAVRYLRLFTDRRFGSEVAEAIARLRPDVVLVDAMLPAAVAAAVGSGIRTVVLVHTVLDFVTGSFRRGPVGVAAAAKGFPLGRSLGRADALLVTSPAAFDDGRSPSHAVHVGPVFGPGETVPRAAAEDARGILVSLSTIHYAGMTAVLQQIVDALDGVDADVTVTTGRSIAPDELVAPPGIRVERRIPHGELLAGCALVIGHGGHGTTTRALTAGVPVLVRPMSSLGDHPAVAEAVARAGVGGRIPTGASVDDIRGVIRTALADDALTRRARDLGTMLRADQSTQRAADLVESPVRRAGALTAG